MIDAAKKAYGEQRKPDWRGNDSRHHGITRIDAGKLNLKLSAIEVPYHKEQRDDARYTLQYVAPVAEVAVALHGNA